MAKLESFIALYDTQSYEDGMELQDRSGSGPLSKVETLWFAVLVECLITRKLGD